MKAKTKKYVGLVSTQGTSAVTRVDSSPLPARLDLAGHSPEGFDWGNGSPGAAQLALALLADCLEDDRRALDLHEEFKWYVIARLEQGRGWTLEKDYIHKIVGELALARPRRHVL